MPQQLANNLAGIVAAAGTAGSASRSELLAAAVTARADVGVLTVLLKLPEGCYRDVNEVMAALLVTR